MLVRRMALWHPKVSYSDWGDFRYGVVLDGINGSSHIESFWRFLESVLEKTNRHERVEVYWWYYPFVYVDVTDTRWNHYPCGHRFCASFDLTNGEVASKHSENRYIFARKGWIRFAESLTSEVRKYSDCGKPDKETSC